MRVVLQKTHCLHERDPCSIVLRRFADDMRAAVFPSSDYVVRRFRELGMS